MYVLVNYKNQGNQPFVNYNFIHHYIRKNSGRLKKWIISKMRADRIKCNS